MAETAFLCLVVSAIIAIPPIKRLPQDADDKTRSQMYWEYVDECVAANRSWFLPVGVKRRWWHLFKVEHPKTTKK